MLKKRLFLALASMAFGSMLLAAKTDFTSVIPFNNTPAFECSGGGSETFSNLGSSASSYATRTWTGNDGVRWSATDARTDQDLNGDAVALRTSVLKNTSAITGGAGTVSFNYKRVFTGNSTLKLFVNGLQYGADISVSSDASTTFTQAINVPGNVVIELRNSGNRIIVDDLTWTCFSNPVTGPELQLTNTTNVNQACGGFTINFGSQNVSAYNDVVFNIKNTGNTNLDVSSLSLSNTDDFSIVSPTGNFTVAPSGASTVVVRFDAAIAGAKTGTLTINSNDADEATCVVNLTGIGLNTCAVPIAESALVAADSITASSATITTTNIIADNYLAIITTASSLSEAPTDAVNYSVGDSIGGGIVAYKGEQSAFTLSDLDEVTNYNVFVYPYNVTECTGGPVYFTQDTLSTGFTTLKAPCIGGSETFSNLGTNQSNYTTRTWTGDNNITWSATDARTDQDLTGDAITLRQGRLTNTVPVSGGIDTLTFNYKRAFTGNSTLKVLVNGVQYGDDVTVSLTTVTQYSQPINIDGPVTISIQNSDNRTVVDDISWGCYTVPANQELQLLDNALAPKTCGGLALNFGTVRIDSLAEATFNIRNLGLTALNVQSLTLSDTLNYSIVTPAATPFSVDSLATQQVVVRFNAATAGSYPATLTIESNDLDEASCTVNLSAIAQAQCVAPVTGNVNISDVTSDSASVEFTATDASGYIAILSTTGSPTVPVNGLNYAIGDTLGDGFVTYVGSDSQFLLSALDAGTNYTLTVYPYNDTDCFDGPVFAISPIVTEVITTEVVCAGGTETFTNTGSATTAYSTKTWTGDNDIRWTATDSRNDQLLGGSKAITLRTGYVTNTTLITGGIDTLSFSYARIFTGNSTLKVYVNDVQIGGDITVSLDTPTIFSQVVNVAGNATVRIVNSGNRTIIDNVTYNCYEAPAARKALAVNNGNTTSQNVILYPNPANGRFHISFGTATANIAVFNVLGEMVLSKTINNNDVVDLSSASKGLYTVTVTANGKTTNHKVVIQ
jgi:hypothetical protein